MCLLRTRVRLRRPATVINAILDACTVLALVRFKLRTASTCREPLEPAKTHSAVPLCRKSDGAGSRAAETRADVAAFE